MTRFSTVVIAMLMVAASTLIARAELVSLTYTEYVRSMVDTFHKVAKARGLSRSEAALAERLATTWVYTGPCKSNPPGEMDSDLRMNAISTVLAADPANKLQSAILEMIAILLTQDNFGWRYLTKEGSKVMEMSSEACRFALETAVPHVKEGRK